MLTQLKENNDQQNEVKEISEVQCCFMSMLPKEFSINENQQIQLSTSSENKDLEIIVKQMILENNIIQEKQEEELKKRKLQFLVYDINQNSNVFLTSTLQDIIDKLSLKSEQIIQIWYTFALNKPKPSLQIPQEEWISAIKSLTFFRDVKSQTSKSQTNMNKSQYYIAAFFNGDLKLYDGRKGKKDHNELLHVKQLHEGKIQDVLYLNQEELQNKQLIVTISESPFPELKISEVMQNNQLEVRTKANEQFAEQLGGWNALASNPIYNDTFLSSTQFFEQKEGESLQSEQGSIQLWKITSEALNNMSSQQEGSLKRQKTQISQIKPVEFFHVKGKVRSLAWMNSSNFVAGCNDQALKIVDVENNYTVKQSIIMNHKVPTCLDTSQDSLILTGCEDGIIRLWDIRQGQNRGEKHQTAKYKGHEKYITQVKFNPLSENVFISGSMDGSVKLWDLRNDEYPVANLKNKQSQDNQNFKIFATEWNGPSQILAGGSDDHISVYSM